jgi:hypothetical protein
VIGICWVYISALNVPMVVVKVATDMVVKDFGISGLIYNANDYNAKFFKRQTNDINRT